MPISLSGISSSFHSDGTKIDTSLCVKKLWKRTNYIESNFEEDIDLNKSIKN